MAKLILINGAIASGKTTLAKAYAELNPMTLVLDIDSIWFKISGWRDNWDKSSKLAKEVSYAMAGQYLQSGNDVVIPQIISKPGIIENLQQLTKDTSADYVEIYIDLSLEVALSRYIERNGDGMPDGYYPDPNATDKSRAEKQKDRYEKMIKLLESRDYTPIYFRPTANDVLGDAKRLDNILNN